MLYDDMVSGKLSEGSTPQRELGDIQHSIERIEKLLHRGQNLLYDEGGREIGPPHGTMNRRGDASIHDGEKKNSLLSMKQMQRRIMHSSPTAHVARKMVSNTTFQRTATELLLLQRQHAADVKQKKAGVHVRHRETIPFAKGTHHSINHGVATNVKWEAADSSDYEDVSIAELRVRIRKELEAYRLNGPLTGEKPKKHDIIPQRVTRLYPQRKGTSQEQPIKMVSPQSKRRHFTGNQTTGTPQSNGHEGNRNKTTPSQISLDKNASRSPLHGNSPLIEKHHISPWKRLYDDAIRMQEKRQHHQMASPSWKETSPAPKRNPWERGFLIKRLSTKLTPGAPSHSVQQTSKASYHRRETHDATPTAASVGESRKRSESVRSLQFPTCVLPQRLLKPQKHHLLGALGDSKKKEGEGILQEHHPEPKVNTTGSLPLAAEEEKSDEKELDIVNDENAAGKAGMKGLDTSESASTSNQVQWPTITPPSTDISERWGMFSHATNDTPLVAVSQESSPTNQLHIPLSIRPLDLSALRK
ncbi:hypothetical protein MOQ_006397 [Trypanosoma cruzi marinkellei]|uniref:Uncharacterized protein n=1 Tax=Trypanosoma cruzi marinkellei TaxID=85056 RepID=K2NLM4_TRYCR|nr:hypothetical protein MOQ_006397 [Trypanosoma cruzi marinkellei]